ncbi:condensation domain-containing protein [Streptomyces sp. NPDC007088]|uniref:condensation domain-containing protein n=1 Tax=Streptomyces sp. NPDC007088 TaxID=3364773 RepID=UPI0036B60A99
MAPSVTPPPDELRLAGLVRPIWETVLGRPVTTDEDFFEAGGDSLTALAVASAVSRATGRPLPAGWLYRHPRFEDGVRSLLQAATAGISAPVTQPRQGHHPLSFQQEGLLDVIAHIGGNHRYQVAYAVAMDPTVDIGRLQAAWERMPERHPVLATRLARHGGERVQDVSTAAQPALETIAAPGGGAGQETDRWASAPIALDEPLVRVGLVRGADGVRLVLAAHQMVMDPWSWGLLLQDLSALYASPNTEGAPELAYSDYARWQRTHLTGDTYARHLDFWRESADGFPADGMRLPGARGDAGPAGPAARLPVHIPDARVAALEAWARAAGASLFEVLLALFNLAVGRWAGTDDVLVASATASRTAPGTQDVAGFFVNGRFTRTRLPAGTVADLIDRVKQSWRAADEHRELHLEKTLFDLDRPDMANVKFSLNTVPGLAQLPVLGGQRLRAVPVTGAASARRHLSVGLTRVGGALAGAVTYRTDVLGRNAVAGLLGEFDRAQRAFAAGPDQHIALTNH